jgi:signal transduction histidine kinase
MRRLLGVLRNDEAAARTPQPQIEQIAALIDTARNAGVPVDYSLDGAVDAIPSAVGVCAYRIVQEALSNERDPAAIGHRLGTDQPGTSGMPSSESSN